MSERVKPESPDPIPTEYAKGQWTPIGYTTKEGGEIQKIERSPPQQYSSIFYENGWVYDNVLKDLGESPWRFHEWPEEDKPDGV